MDSLKTESLELANHISGSVVSASLGEKINPELG